jgi:hypothetical protein
MQKIWKGSLSSIRTSYEQELVKSIPKVGQAMFRYCTQIRITLEQALVSKYKHNKTLINNNTNWAKLEKEKQELYFSDFFIKFLK